MKSVASSRLSDQVLFVVVGNGMRTFADLAVAMALARLLTPSDFGTFRQVFLVYGLVAGMAGLGLPASLSFFIPGADRSSARRIAWRTFTLLGAASLLTVVVVVLLGPWMAGAFSSPGLQRLLLFAALYPLGQMSAEALTHLLVALERHRAAGLTAILIALVQAGAVIVPALLGAGLEQLALFASAAAGVQVAAALGLTWWHLGPFAAGGHSGLGPQVRYAAPLGVHGVIASLTPRLDRLLISLFHTPSTLAVYSVGATEVPLVPMLPYTVGRTLIPRFVQLHREGDRAALLSLWHQSILKVSLILLPCFALCFLLATWIMATLFGPGFVAAAVIFRVYLLLLPLRPTAYGAILQALDDTPAILAGGALAVLLNAAFGLMLLPVLGWIGPAVGAVAAQIFLILFYLRRIRRRLGASWPQIWPWRSYGIRCVLTLVATLVAAPLFWLPFPASLAPWAVVVVFTLVYVAGALKIGALGRPEIDLVKRWLSLRVLRQS